MDEHYTTLIVRVLIADEIMNEAMSHRHAQEGEEVEEKERNANRQMIDVQCRDMSNPVNTTRNMTGLTTRWLFCIIECDD